MKKTSTRVTVTTTTTVRSDGVKASTTTIDTEGDLTVEQIKDVLGAPDFPRSKWLKDLWKDLGL